MRILINGLLPYDSGKTTIARSLLKILRDLGFDVGFSKPISGINGWYQYECIERSLEFGFLVGEDMLRLYEVCKEDLKVTCPVISIVFPPDFERVFWRTDTIKFHIPTMMRILHDHIVFEDSLSLLPKTLKEIVHQLIEVLKPLKSRDFNRMFDKSIKVADECLRKIEHDVVLIESYSNVSSPTLESSHVDFVLTVAPAKVALMKGEEFRRALDVMQSKPWNVTTESILEILKPIKTFDVPPKDADKVAYDITSFIFREAPVG